MFIELETPAHSVLVGIYAQFVVLPGLRELYSTLSIMQPGLVKMLGDSNTPYEKVKTFKYLGSLLTNQNSIQEDIRCRVKAGNSYYYSVQTLLSSSLLS